MLQAVLAAHSADVVVAVMGHDCSFENEGVDRGDDDLGTYSVTRYDAFAINR